MPSVIKAKPGSYKGVKYRSQLEIKWAMYLEEVIHKGAECVYVDESNHDFQIRSEYGVSAKIEVKPRIWGLCESAIARLEFGDFCESDRWFLFIGQPPSPYGTPWFVKWQFCECSNLYGPFLSRAAIVSVGDFLQCERNSIWGAMVEMTALQSILFPMCWPISQPEWDTDCDRQIYAQSILHMFDDVKSWEA